MKKEFRLKKRAAFTYVYKRGERTRTRHLALIYAKSGEGLKIGLSVSSKVGGAVVRNRVKRLLREALTPLVSRIDPGYLYVIAVQPSVAELDFHGISEAVGTAFARAGKLRAEE